MTVPSLTAPFAHTSEIQKGSQKLTYIPAAEVIERLNAVLGYGHWSYEVVEAFHIPADDPQYVVVRGRLRVLEQVYEQYGGTTPNRYGERAAEHLRGRIIDLGDDYKGAASDAMKKAAQMAGVGLYLALKRAPTPFSISDEATAPVATSDAPEVTPHPASGASTSGGGEPEAPQTPPAPAPGVTSPVGAAPAAAESEPAGEPGGGGGFGEVPPAAADLSPEELLEREERRRLIARFNDLPISAKAEAMHLKRRLQVRDWFEAEPESIAQLKAKVTELEAVAS